MIVRSIFPSRSFELWIDVDVDAWTSAQNVPIKEALRIIDNDRAGKGCCWC